MATGFDWFCPDDLPIFFKAHQKTPTPAILVGGLSLTFWIERFDITIPPIETPYLTMDKAVIPVTIGFNRVTCNMKAVDSTRYSVYLCYLTGKSCSVPEVLPSIGWP